MIPYLLTGSMLHIYIGLAFVALGFIYGSLLLAIFVPGATKADEASKAKIQVGFQLYAAGAIGFILGGWSVIILILVVLFLVGSVAYKGWKLIHEK